MSYTPGPWNIGPKTARYQAESAEALRSLGVPSSFEALSIGTESGQVAIVPLDESSEDNAHLISAAPNMLEALRDCIALYDGRDDEDVPGYIMDARAAIAKAEGRE